MRFILFSLVSLLALSGCKVMDGKMEFSNGRETYEVAKIKSDSVVYNLTQTRGTITTTIDGRTQTQSADSGPGTAGPGHAIMTIKKISEKTVEVSYDFLTYIPARSGGSFPVSYAVAAEATFVKGDWASYKSGYPFEIKLTSGGAEKQDRALKALYEKSIKAQVNAEVAGSGVSVDLNVKSIDFTNIPLKGTIRRLTRKFSGQLTFDLILQK